MNEPGMRMFGRPGNIGFDEMASLETIESPSMHEVIHQGKWIAKNIPEWNISLSLNYTKILAYGNVVEFFQCLFRQEEDGKLFRARRLLACCRSGFDGQKFSRDQNRRSTKTLSFLLVSREKKFCR